MTASSRLVVHYPQGTRSLASDSSQKSRLISDLLRQAGLPLNTRCGQRGLCDGCMVELLSGTLVQAESGQTVDAREKPRLVRGCEYRLAAEQDAEIHVPARSLLAHEPQVVTSFRLNVSRAHDPLWQRVSLSELSLPPDLPGPEAICQALARYRDEDLPVRADAALLATSSPATVPPALALEHRGDHWALVPVTGRADRPVFGAAVDIGTTTVVVLLVDLANGEVIGTASALNGQTNLGDNVLTRINLCMSEPAMLGPMQDAITQQTLVPLLEQVLIEAGVSPAHLASLVFAGNTTMLHLLLGVDPTPLGTAPFTPVFLNHRVLPASEVPLLFSKNGSSRTTATEPAAQGGAGEDTAGECGAKECEAPNVTRAPRYSEESSQATGEAASAVAQRPLVHLLPGAAAYVGADITAGVLSCGMAYRTDTCLLVDVGTNGEIVLKRGERLLGCATAAGPAFEGAGLRCGVRAGRGAISHIRLTGDLRTPEIEVIGGDKPIGLCGTAYIDFLAQGRQAGILATNGRFTPEAFAQGLIDTPEHAKVFRVAYARGKEPLAISEADVASLLQAKAAIAAGILCLLDQVGLRPEEVDTLYLAGGFGFHMDIDNVLGCGLLPGFRREQIHLAGNTSLAGAYLALLDSGVLAEIKRISARLEIIELNLDPHFESHYIDQLSLP